MRVIVLFVLAILILPIFVHADALVNINTASVPTLDGLPYITPTVAQAIYDYRKENPFVVIEDIMKVNGIKEGIFGHIQSLITVGDTGASNASNTVSTSTTSSTVSSSLGGDMETYTPPPSALTIDAGPYTQDAVMNVPLLFSARVTTKSGTIDSSARIEWGFGDGSSAAASAVKKTYYYAGTYLVVVTATDSSATARNEITVTVRPAQVHILEIPNAGIMITNDATERLDLSNWAISTDVGSYRIPSGTIILQKANTILPSIVTHLATAPEVTLAYPDGSIAARYVPQESPVKTVTQPRASSASSNEVQKVEPPAVSKVEPITSIRTNVQSHEEAASAPAAATGLAAAGAALPATPPKTSSLVGNLLKSPWTLGFIGTVILAGGAFILL